MKIKVQIGSSDSTVLLLPIDCAGVLGALLGNAQVMERDGWTSPAVYKPSAEGVRVDYVPDGAFEKPSEELIAARKEAERKNSDWASEYQKNKALQQELREANAALEAMRSVQGCRAPQMDRGEDEVP